MGDAGGVGGFLPDLVEVFVEEETDGRDAHGGPVAVGAAGEKVLGEGAAVFAVACGGEEVTHAGAVAAGGVVGGGEGLHEGVVLDLAVGAEVFGESDHHLGVVGVVEFVDGGRGDDLGGRRRTGRGSRRRAFLRRGAPRASPARWPRRQPSKRDWRVMGMGYLAEFAPRIDAASAWTFHRSECSPASLRIGGYRPPKGGTPNGVAYGSAWRPVCFAFIRLRWFCG